MPFSHMSCEELKQKLESGPDSLTIIDIRDAQSYSMGSIEGAIHIDNSNVANFLNNTDMTKDLVVCCYHGNSSQGAADYFNQQGFKNTYSLDGGYETWRSLV